MVWMKLRRLCERFLASVLIAFLRCNFSIVHAAMDGPRTIYKRRRQGNQLLRKSPILIQNTKEPEKFAPEQHQSDYELEVGDYIAAIYEEDHKPYIGKIMEVDEDDVHATFMEASASTINYRSTLKWPRNPDEI